MGAYSFVKKQNKRYRDYIAEKYNMLPIEDVYYNSLMGLAILRNKAEEIAKKEELKKK